MLLQAQGLVDVHRDKSEVPFQLDHSDGQDAETERLHLAHGFTSRSPRILLAASSAAFALSRRARPTWFVLENNRGLQIEGRASPSLVPPLKKN